MTTEKDVIRSQILDLVKKYYEAEEAERSTAVFVKGQTRIPYASRVYNENEMVSLVDASLDFWLTQGRYAELFEQKFADFLGVKYALLVNSGSSANLLAFMALTSHLLGERKINRGDEVITVAAGFPTTIAPIIQYGAVPVFVDIDLQTFNIDVCLLEKALSKKTKAIFLAHTLGNPFDLEKVKQFCDKHDLWLIEDNCDALGSLYDGQLTGTFGDIGTSSFYPPHHMTMGEGGAVYTNNNLLKKVLLSMRDWGRDCWCVSGEDNSCSNRFSHEWKNLPFGYDHKYVYSHFGYNLKVTDMQAAIGCVQLDKLNSFCDARRRNFALFKNALKKYEDVFLLPEATDKGEPSWFGFMLTLRDYVSFKRNDLSMFLEKRNIQTRNLFGGNMVRQPVFEHLSEGIDYRVIGELTNTDKVMNDSLWFGVYPGMTVEKIEYIIESIGEFLNTNE